MSDDKMDEFADCDYVEHRFEKICKLVSIVAPDVVLRAAFISDLSTLYDFCHQPSEEIYTTLSEYFHHDFNYMWFSNPLWMFVDYIDANVGWPEQKQ